MDCFCGCGRPVPFSKRGDSKRGAKIVEELEHLNALLVPELRQQRLNPRLDALRATTGRLLEQGAFLKDELTAYVHGEVDRRPRDVATFLRESQSHTVPLRDVAKEREREQDRGG